MRICDKRKQVVSLVVKKFILNNFLILFDLKEATK